MPMRPLSLLVPLLGIALAFVSPITLPEMAKTRRGRGGPTAPADPASSWSSDFRLKKYMGDATEWAGEALKRGGQPPAYVLEPTAIVSSPLIVADVLRKDWDTALTLLGAKDAAAKAQLAATMAEYVIAVYAPDTGAIHILPENAKRAALAAGNPELLSDDVLRLLLARMCVMALDRQHTAQAKEAIDAADSLDALQIAGAILQGHVQYHTRRIASFRNRVDSDYSPTAFEDLVALLTAPVPGDASPALRAFASNVKFAVVDGENFMTNIPRRTHALLLRTPPKNRGAIFDPKAFVTDMRSARTRGPKDLHLTVQKEFGAAVLTEGDWNQEVAALDQDAAKVLLEPLASNLYSMAIAAFKGGHRIQNTQGDEPVLDLYVLEFSKAGPAESFVSLVQGAAKQRGASVESGAGRDDNLAGFHGTEVVGEDDAKATWAMQWTSEGRFVVGFRTTAPITKVEDRDPYDDAMEAAAEALAKVAKTRDSRRRRRGR